VPVEPARPPEIVAPPPGHPRFPGLDALRAIAALGVLLSHAAYTSGATANAWYGSLVAQGVSGVTVFFVLSGFLLYRPFLAADLDGLRPVRLRDYARRRTLRIVPAYWLALTTIALWLGLDEVFSSDWWKYYGLLQVYDPDTSLHGLAAAWTLCVEVSFYAWLPLHATVMRRLSRGRSRAWRLHAELVALALLAALSVGLRAWSLFDVGGVIPITLAGTFAWFAIGMGFAVLSVRGGVTVRPWLCWAVALAALLVMAEGLKGLSYSPRQWLFQHVVAAVLAAALVAPAAFGDGGAIRRFLTWRPLMLTGVVSYGIYLWQGAWVVKLPDAGFAELAALTIVASLATATASYLLLERPLMRLKNRRRGPPRRAAGPASARALEPDTAPRSPR
jgi:peptidoglycan/LPS O-acetylase OafA/YrhL